SSSGEPVPGRKTSPSTTRPVRLRSACDFCTKRRRKCDGDGVRPCSLCKAKNRPSCHYSVRLPTGPRRNANDAAASTRNPPPSPRHAG
ncbi:unnamed protein product, partial [Sphacelaria rigidula]